MASAVWTLAGKNPTEFTIDHVPNEEENEYLFVQFCGKREEEAPDEEAPELIVSPGNIKVQPAEQVECPEDRAMYAYDLHETKKNTEGVVAGTTAIHTFFEKGAQLKVTSAKPILKFCVCCADCIPAEGQISAVRYPNDPDFMCLEIPQEFTLPDNKNAPGALLRLLRSNRLHLSKEQVNYISTHNAPEQAHAQTTKGIKNLCFTISQSSD